MDLVVAGRADHEGLAPPFRHEPGQCWLAVEGVPEAVHLRTGDCFLLPLGRPFRLASDLALPPWQFRRNELADVGVDLKPVRDIASRRHRENERKCEQVFTFSVGDYEIFREDEKGDLVPAYRTCVQPDTFIADQDTLGKLSVTPGQYQIEGKARLAGPRRSDDGDGAPARHLERDALDDRPGRLVVKGHFLEADRRVLRDVQR